jgi:hypothetical protein
MITTIQKQIKRNAVELPYGVELDANGIPVGSCTVPELFDELDQEFIEFYGEYGRKLVNKRRIKWNKDRIWKFKLF